MSKFDIRLANMFFSIVRKSDGKKRLVASRIQASLLFFLIISGGICVFFVATVTQMHLAIYALVFYILWNVAFLFVIGELVSKNDAPPAVKEAIFYAAGNAIAAVAILAGTWDNMPKVLIGVAFVGLLFNLRAAWENVVSIANLIYAFLYYIFPGGLIHLVVIALRMRKARKKKKTVASRPSQGARMAPAPQGQRNLQGSRPGGQPQQGGQRSGAQTGKPRPEAQLQGTGFGGGLQGSQGSGRQGQGLTPEGRKKLEAMRTQTKGATQARNNYGVEATGEVSNAGNLRYRCKYPGCGALFYSSASEPVCDRSKKHKVPAPQGA